MGCFVWDVCVSVWVFSLPVIPAPEGSCRDCRTLRNANVCCLRGGKITLIMCGWTDRMVSIEHGECVWTDRGLCYYSRAPASGPRLCGAQCECLHSLDAGPEGWGLQLSIT